MRVRVSVCAREDRIHPVRHWLVRAGPTQHPGNYPGPAAVEHPLAIHPTSPVPHTRDNAATMINNPRQGNALNAGND